MYALLPILVTLIFSLAFMPAASSENLESVANGNNDFGFKLLHELSGHENKDPNLFISPLSIGEVLKMAVNGAAGKTKEEIASVLNLGGQEPAQINAGDKRLLAMITAPNKFLASQVEKGDPNFRLKIANSLWGNKDVKFNPVFIDSCRTNYGAEVQALNFTDPQSPTTINNWIGSKTQGKISKVITELNPADVLVLVNATYFKAAWETVFQKEETKPQDFHADSGKTLKVPTMHRSARMPYTSNSNCEIIKLPYADKQTSMYVLLPKPGKQPSDLISGLSATRWKELTASLGSCPGEIYLPKFKFTYSSHLKDTLIRLGMKVPFEPNTADFSKMVNMAQRLWVSDVIHKTFVDVNEEGTEAAAVTVMTMCGASAPPPQTPFTMKVDRPFIFAITNDSTDTIIFMGIVGDPSHS